MESDDAFTVRADAPGFDPEDVNISLKDGIITISGRKDNDKKQERDGKVSLVGTEGHAHPPGRVLQATAALAPA